MNRQRRGMEATSCHSCSGGSGDDVVIRTTRGKAFKAVSNLLCSRKAPTGAELVTLLLAGPLFAVWQDVNAMGYNLDVASVHAPGFEAEADYDAETQHAYRDGAYLG